MRTLEEELADLDSRGDEVIMIPQIKSGTLKAYGRRGNTYPDYLYPERIEYEVEKMIPFVASELAQGIREFEAENEKIWDTVAVSGKDDNNRDTYTKGNVLYEGKYE